MIKLKTLSKLRQFFPNQSIQDYLLNEHRQNLIAIEHSFNNNSVDSTFYMQILPISVDTNQAITLTYLDTIKIDDGGAESAGIITIKKDTTYDVNINLINFTVTSAKTVLLNVIVNSSIVKQFVIYESNSASSFIFPVNYSFPLSLNKNDKLYYQITNTGGSGSVVFGYGLLKMNALNI